MNINVITVTITFITSMFNHSFIQAISIVPLQVHYYSEASPQHSMDTKYSPLVVIAIIIINVIINDIPGSASRS